MRFDECEPCPDCDEGELHWEIGDTYAYCDRCESEVCLAKMFQDMWDKEKGGDDGYDNK